MKFKNITQTIFIIFLTAGLYVNAQWQNTNGPSSAAVTSFGKDKANLYAGTNDGYVYRSTDAGKSWRGKKIALADESLGGIVRVIYAKDSLVFAGVNCAGVFKSTDFGETWKLSSEAYQYIYSIIRIDNKLFYSSHIGAYRSTNYGESWEQISTGWLYSLAAIGNKLFKGGAVSTDFGNTWQAITFPQGYIAESNNTFITGDNVIYCTARSSTNNSTLLRSKDAGITWTPLSYINSILYFYAEGSSLYIAEYYPTNDFYSSTNFGDSWSINKSATLGFKGLSIICYDSRLYVGSNRGVYISDDNGNSWTQSSKGFNNSTVNGFKKYGSQIYAITTTGVAKTDAAAIDWNDINKNLNVFDNRAICFAGNSIFLGNNDGVYKTDTTDLTWNFMAKKGGYVSSLTVMNDYLFAGSEYLDLQKTKVTENNWSTVKSIYANCLEQKGNVLIAAAKQGVFASTDMGNTFSYLGLKSTYENKNLFSTAVIFKDSYFAGDKYGFYKLLNNGAEYETLLAGEVYSAAASDSRIYVSNKDGLFMSENGGNTFKSINSGLEGLTVTSLLEEDKYLYIGIKGKGVWRKPISQLVTSISVKNGLPASFSLGQNYPNPFNPSTKISYSIVENCFVKLTVHDITGKEIAALVNKELSAGNYTVDFNAFKLSSGVYFYTMRAGRNVISRKMVVLK